MRKASLLDIGDSEDGYIVMLTPEGREALSKLTDVPGQNPGESAQLEGTDVAPTTMPESGRKSLLKRVVDFLVLHPGSTRDQIKKQFPDELKALSVALCDGRRNDRISMRKDGDQESFHPGPNALVKLAPNRKTSKEKRTQKPFPVVNHEGERIDGLPAAEQLNAIPPENNFTEIMHERHEHASREPEKGKTLPTLLQGEEKAAMLEARKNGETQLLPTGRGIPAEPKRTAPSRFRVGWTSDRTILLWGISPDPIELNEKDSETLVDFIHSRRRSR